MKIKKLCDRLKDVRKNVDSAQNYAAVLSNSEKDRILADICDALVLLLEARGEE